MVPPPPRWSPELEAGGGLRRDWVPRCRQGAILIPSHSPPSFHRPPAGAAPRDLSRWSGEHPSPRVKLAPSTRLAWFGASPPPGLARSAPGIPSALLFANAPHLPPARLPGWGPSRHDLPAHSSPSVKISSATSSRKPSGVLRVSDEALSWGEGCTLSHSPGASPGQGPRHFTAPQVPPWGDPSG